MQDVTADRIRQISKAPFAEWGYAAPTGGGEDPLDLLLLPAAEQFVLHITGWDSYAAVPAEKEALVELAIRLAVEMIAAQSRPEYLETLEDFDLISSFSAGSYSETRRSVDEALKAKMLAAWPPLNAALLGAMTDEARDDYLGWLDGKVAPSFEVSEVNWGAGYMALWGWEDPVHSWSQWW